MDPLADVLRVSRVRGAVLARVLAGDPWGIDIVGTSGAAMHAVIVGACWLRLTGALPLQLMPGDIVLLPTGAPHTVASAPTGPAESFTRLAKRQLISPEGNLHLGGAGAVTRFLCASYEHDHDSSQRLLSVLPRVVHVPAARPGDSTALTLQMLAAELGSGAPGTGTAVDRLIDVLLVHVLRSWMAAQPQGAPSWVLGLKDPITAAALRLLHERTAEPWTSDRLADAVGVSRATLSRRFRDRVGQPPMQYLTAWRMDLAAATLRSTTAPVDTVARQVGYTSEFAFNRAFSRTKGQPPGRYRAAVAASRGED